MSVEIPDFMSPEEADHIVNLSEEYGFAKSDIHLDPVAKQHAQTLRSTEGNDRYLSVPYRETHCRTTVINNFRRNTFSNLCRSFQ